MTQNDEILFQYEELRNDVSIRKEADGDFEENAIFSIFSECATECGDAAGDIIRSRHEQRGMRVDGYHFEEVDSPLLTIVVSKFNQQEEITSMNTQEAEDLFKRAKNFVEKSATPDFIEKLEESSDIYQLADILQRSMSEIQRVKIILMTDAVLASRKKEWKADEQGDRRYSYHILDFSRYVEIIKSRNQRDPVTIDMSDLGISPIPFLLTAETEKYASYLLAIPGKDLAKIYDYHRDRLLEQNVRTFLQARGKVNKGIIRTIREEPEMFFAYNNGLTTTAEAIKIEDGKIISIHDFQIVNGGQTTASLLYAQEKHGADLSSVYVQVKLSVVSEKDEVEEIVPRISRYANTQNKISDADLFSNDPFHVKMKSLSMQTLTPNVDGGAHSEKWFYERARGQYQNEQFLMTSAARKRFQAEYPRAKIIHKTDMAKYCMAYDGYPHFVGKGAQANFRKFAEIITDEWAKNEDKFNQRWFKHAVSKAILYKSIDKVAAAMAKKYRDEGNAYDRGYKAHITAYSVAWIANHFKKDNKEVDLDRIWNTQNLEEEFLALMHTIIKHVEKCLLKPPQEHAYLGKEWCKQQACWIHVKELEIPIDIEKAANYAVDAETFNEDNKRAQKEQKQETGLNWEIDCVDIGEEWDDIMEHVRKYGTEVTGDMEKAVKRVVKGNLPNPKQMKSLRNLFDQATDADYKRKPKK